MPLPRVVFVLATGTCCLGFGTWIGGRYFVPAGSGLAGPPLALSYGIAGAAAGCLGAALLASRLSARRLRFAALLISLAAAALSITVIGRVCAQATQEQLPDGERFHTSPECWTEPRIFHPGPPPADIANRIHLTETPSSAPEPGESTLSPNGGYRFWLRNPDTTRPPPWSAGVIIDVERGTRPNLLFEDVVQPIDPRWLTEKLIYLRVAWSRILFSDLILDVERKELVYNEVAEYGQVAFEQYKRACGGRCPCELAGEGAAKLPVSRPAANAIRGLLAMPTLFGGGETGGVIPAMKPAPVVVYLEPDAKAAVIGRPVNPEDIEYREISYESAAAVVHDVSPGWYAIKLANRGIGWVRAEDTGAYTSVAQLLPSRLTYLNEHWSGELWSVPDQDATVRQSNFKKDEGRQEYSVAIREVRETPYGLWLHVGLHDRDPCSGGAPGIAEEGWVPAYSNTGQLSAWYHARGC